MSNVMKGVIKFKDGKDGWSYCGVPRPDPLPDEVEIQVECIGICGSELHLYHDNHFYTPPVVVGHEFCGRISRIGENVTGWAVGDRVVTDLGKVSCGQCTFCRKGLPNFCPDGKAVGYDIAGGWAEYYCTPANLLFRLPDSISYEIGAMVEPCNIVTNALIVRNTFRPGDVVLVQGCGTIGMLAAMTAKAIGAKAVILTGTNADEEVRLPIARSIQSIDAVVNVEKQDLSEEIRKTISGSFVDLIVEASGSASAIYGMTDVLKKCGKIVVIGEAAKPEIAFRWNNAVFKSCSIEFCFGEGYDSWVDAIQLMASGKMELDKIITHRLPLKEFQKGFELLEKKKGLKVLMFPEHSQC